MGKKMKTKITFSLDKDAADYVEKLAGSRRKMGETLSQIVAEHERRQNISVAEAVRRIGDLHIQLAELLEAEE